MTDVRPGEKEDRAISLLWISLGLALVLLLAYLWLANGPAPITGERVFGGGDLIVRPPQSGDAHRISERQARDALDQHVFVDYSQPPRLILFGFGRVTAHSLAWATTNIDRPAWIGVYRVSFSALFFGCPQETLQPPFPPKPRASSFDIAIIIDRDSGRQILWGEQSPDLSSYMAWACATGHAQL